jgi:hypothetical protein
VSAAVRVYACANEKARWGRPLAFGVVTEPMPDHADFSVVAQVREGSTKPWKWAIYRAGRGSPVKTSSKLSFKTRVEAMREGEKALQLLLSADHGRAPDDRDRDFDE